MLFGRVSPEIYVLNKWLRYYHSIGAGVDAILTQDLVESDVILASEKGRRGYPPRRARAGAPARAHARAPHGDPEVGLHAARADPPRAVGAIRQDHGHRRLGGTGRAVAQRAHGFGMRLLAVDIADRTTTGRDS